MNKYNLNQTVKVNLIFHNQSSGASINIIVDVLIVGVYLDTKNNNEVCYTGQVVDKDCKMLISKTFNFKEKNIEQNETDNTETDQS